MKEKLEKIGKKKIILLVVFFVIIIVILLGGAYVYNKFFYKRSYAEIENIMLSAARNHMNKHPDDLPKSINGSVSLSVSDMTRMNEMKEISFYLKNDSVSCTGNVNVVNINGSYRYTPILDCGTAYKTKKLIDYIKENVAIVTNGSGLYELNDELVYRGEYVNNYIKLSGKTYRIVKFSSEEAVIIYSEKAQSVSWDSHYNLEKDGNVGINNYSVSDIREYLNQLYKNNNILDVDNNGVQSKSLVVAYNLNVGKRGNNDTDKTGSLEKAAVIENQFIGLLPIYDFMNASLDENCTTTVSPSCMNYNYLSDYNSSWWTITSTNMNTFHVFKINKSSSVSLAKNNAAPRHVFHITRDALYVSGDGTVNNPYIVK